MRVSRPGFAVGCAIVFSHGVIAPAHAQFDRGRAPVIRVTGEFSSSVVSNYIEPSIRLSEDAYVFAISVDVDQSIQVLHPDDPGISVKMSARKRLQLPRFFAGYADPRRRTGTVDHPRYMSSSYDFYEPGFSDTRGTIIALASRKPFNLAAITTGGEWDLEGVRLLVEARDPTAAAVLLARYLGAKGEPIGRDIHRFAGAPRYYSNAFYGSGAFYDCQPGHGAGGYGGYGVGVGLFRAMALKRAGYRITLIGIDACGQPRYAASGSAGAPNPAGNPPATGAFPSSRLPAGTPRHPAKDGTAGDVVGVRPRTGERYTDRTVRIAPPTGRMREPQSLPERFDPKPATSSIPERFHPQPATGSIPERFHPQPATGSFPERERVPAEASQPRGGTGESERAFRPERAPDPTPPRAPERISAPTHVPERMSPPPREPVVERDRPAPAAPPAEKRVDG